MADQNAPIDHADRLWFSLERSYPFLRDVNPDIQEKRKQLQRKEVVISAFGRHNCGKSTLLNVILRNCLLPASIENETCIEIKIRHDSTVHPGPCKNTCIGGSDCPRLEQEISTTERVTVAVGAEEIAEKLRQENRKCRQTGIMNQSGHYCFVLYAFVEILQRAPEGWNLVLVDTPGFGEANVRHVTARTDTLFSTSTAYLYIIDSGSMGDDVDAKKIKLLYQNDRGKANILLTIVHTRSEGDDENLFNDNRFVVAISKYDQRFVQSTLQRRNAGNRQQSAVEIARNVKHKMQSFISESVKCNRLPEVEIVPVSAIWATTAMWLRADPQKDDIQEAQQILRGYPDSLPQGQGEVGALDLASSLDSIDGLPALECNCMPDTTIEAIPASIVSSLEEFPLDKQATVTYLCYDLTSMACQLWRASKPLRGMITNCIRIWRNSLAKSYTGYLEQARLALLDHQQHKTQEIMRVRASLTLHAELNAKMDQLNGLTYVEGDQTPEIEFKLEATYMRKDVETAKRLLYKRIEDMTEALISVLKGKISNAGKPFLQRDFEEEVKKFTKERAEPHLREDQLDIKLEGVAGEFRRALEEMEALDREIEEAARKILRRGWTPPNNFLQIDRGNRGDKDVLGDEVLQKQQLTLGDLHEQITAPPIHIGLLQRFLDRVRSFFGASVTPNSERPYKEWTREMDEVLDGLKNDLISQVDDYITTTLKQWVVQEVLSVSYRNRVKDKAEAVYKTYNKDIREAFSLAEECEARCASDSEMANLEANILKLQDAIQKLQEVI